MSDKLFAQWYNDQYDIMTRILPNANINENITQRTVSAGELAKSQQMQTLINDVDKLKNNKYLAWAQNKPGSFTQVSPGDLIDSSLTKDKISKYLNEIKTFCGNETCSKVSGGGTSGNSNRSCSTSGNNNHPGRNNVGKKVGSYKANSQQSGGCQVKTVTGKEVGNNTSRQSAQSDGGCKTFVGRSDNGVANGNYTQKPGYAVVSRDQIITNI